VIAQVLVIYRKAINIMFKLKNGDPAPEIALRDARGNDWRLSDRRGKMVVLHFCRGEY